MNTTIIQNKKQPNIQDRQLWRWLKQSLSILVLGVILLATLGATYQFIAAQIDRQHYPAPGQLVNVGNYRLHLNVMGQKTDQPTIILDAAAGSFSAQWGLIQPALAEHTQVVAYDRPGLGWSEASPQQLDGFAVVEDLHDALDQLGIAGPYILVGHSMGSLTMRAFAQTYGDEVAGMVLVDPRYLQIDEIMKAQGIAPSDQQLGLLPLLAHLGIIRLSSIMTDVPAMADLPSQQQDELSAMSKTSDYLTNMYSDGQLGYQTAERLKESETLGALPLIVLSASEPDSSFNDKARQIFTATHVKLAKLSTQGSHRLVEGANHSTLVTQSAYAQATIEAVLELMKR